MLVGISAQPGNFLEGKCEPVVRTRPLKCVIWRMSTQIVIGMVYCMYLVVIMYVCMACV